MATKVGTLVLITIGGNELIGELSTSLNTVVNLIEVSSKASNRESNFEYGRISDTLSVNSIASTDGSATDTNWKTLHDAIVAGTKVAVVITEYDAPGGTAVAGCPGRARSSAPRVLSEQSAPGDGGRPYVHR